MSSSSESSCCQSPRMGRERSQPECGTETLLIFVNHCFVAKSSYQQDFRWPKSRPSLLVSSDTLDALN
ncbi:MAG: hypothetical protein K0S42_3247 [Microvirga sp.]|jgi:hypothetical protein|nr:hypothetical protein [Microvirga sp.]